MILYLPFYLPIAGTSPSECVLSHIPPFSPFRWICVCMCVCIFIYWGPNVESCQAIILYLQNYLAHASLRLLYSFIMDPFVTRYANDVFLLYNGYPKNDSKMFPKKQLDILPEQFGLNTQLCGVTAETLLRTENLYRVQS